MTKTITLNAKVGDEVTLVNGDSTLVVKVANEKIIPDFVDAMTEVVKNNAWDIVAACDRVYHRMSESENYLRQVLAEKRDELFMSVNPAPTEEKPTVTVDPKKEPAPKKTDEAKKE